MGGCEINGVAIFLWNKGIYTKKVYENILERLKRYGFEYSINSFEEKQFTIFTEIKESLMPLLLNTFDKEKHHLFFFIT